MAPEVHGEDGAGAVEDGRQGGHQGRDHHGHHEPPEPWSQERRRWPRQAGRQRGQGAATRYGPSRSGSKASRCPRRPSHALPGVPNAPRPSSYAREPDCEKGTRKWPLGKGLGGPERGQGLSRCSAEMRLPTASAGTHITPHPTSLASLASPTLTAQKGVEVEKSGPRRPSPGLSRAEPHGSHATPLLGRRAGACRWNERSELPLGLLSHAHFPGSQPQ